VLAERFSDVLRSRVVDASRVFRLNGRLDVM